MSAIAAIEARPLQIPFKVAFRHASASREAMQSLWVKVRLASGMEGIGEGCPREYVSGEDLHGALAFVAAHVGEWLGGIDGLAGLRSWLARNAALVDRHPAAWSAVELALLDAFAREAGLPLEGLLGVPPPRSRYRYTAVLGDAAPAAFQSQLDGYRRAGFADFKVKLSGDGERDGTKVAALKEAGIAPARVRADANNLWSEADTAITHLHALDFPFFALEEPLRCGDYDGMRRIAEACGARIILDESMLRAAQLEAVSTDAGRWIANVRVSKMGGVLRAVDLVARARALGVGIVVGAHVGETSVLTRAALAVATVAGESLVGQEGAFGTHLLEHEPVTPCLMFGAGGVLEMDAAHLGTGLGLTSTDSMRARPLG
jgi:L-Ala-D/L-Glu epimerase